MANVQIYTSLNTHAVTVWYGTLATATANEIAILSGGLEAVYSGAFSYSNGQVYGTLTGYSSNDYGMPDFSATGLDVSANAAMQLIQAGQGQAFVQLALAGNDQFTIDVAGTHLLDGFAGYNTVTERGTYATFTESSSNGVTSIMNTSENDTLYNIQGVYFSDGYYDTAKQAFYANSSLAGYATVDTTTGHAIGSPQAYSGPVVGVQHQDIEIGADSLNISVSSPNWFIHSGAGNDAIAVSSGTNVLDGGTGSNFLVGGNGQDTFFVDDRNATAAIWSTVSNFHSGDAATIWGVTASDFTLSWMAGQGATGYTGLTLHATAANAPTASLTLAGFGQADLTDGRLAISFGSSGGSNYMYVHGN